MRLQEMKTWASVPNISLIGSEGFTPPNNTAQHQKPLKLRLKNYHLPVVKFIKKKFAK